MADPENDETPPSSKSSSLSTEDIKKIASEVAIILRTPDPGSSSSGKTVLVEPKGMQLGIYIMHDGAIVCI